METVLKGLCCSVIIVVAMGLTSQPAIGAEPNIDRIPGLILYGGGAQPQGAVVNITGAWRSADGSTFYINHKSGTVALYGESSRYTRVCTGSISSGRATIRWYDVPKARQSGLTDGTAELRVKSAKRLELIMQGSTIVLTR